ncbi:metallophosphoesterase family protein [Bacillus sp. B1-b2]|uniref:metallophosphoesterase family protein n=1 Tax=Bacillus sp. B1-b2 TaxID=2653201 RepID=UPI0012621E94|nr:metallophosphoesterase [Bacillus sp. B1-b2]KAB7668062.1 metallophosphoesterase [Bacillus sp. B1-b2]
MNVLIVSDSHGFHSELGQVKDRHEKEVDLFLHCGDSELSKDEKAMQGYVTVQGNCDYEERYPTQTLQNAAGKNIFMTHGHLYGVKSSLTNLSYKAKEIGANIVCFGHSHLLGMEMIEDILYINPGSLRLPRGRVEQTYVILTIEENRYVTNVYDLHKGLLPELKRVFSI